MNLTERIVAIHHALESGGIAHAFGGALALAWCTARPRGTIDIDVNLFVNRADAAAALEALPEGLTVGEESCLAIITRGQGRLYWDQTPVDVFFNTTTFHEEVAQRVCVKFFGGSWIPFLACRDLAVFKAFFNRPQDWVDLEKMVAARTIHPGVVADTLARYVGSDDPRVNRLRRL